LEIYSYNPPDGLACVEHQRREIAHRKRRQAKQSEDECDESRPPLIPTYGYHLGQGFVTSP
jgi:hypothetical protein